MEFKHKEQEFLYDRGKYRFENIMEKKIFQLSKRFVRVYGQIF